MKFEIVPLDSGTGLGGCLLKVVLAIVILWVIACWGISSIWSGISSIAYAAVSEVKHFSAWTNFEHGTVENNLYSSEFLGIEAALDSDWKVYTDSQLASLNGISDMDGKAKKKVYGSELVEMYAVKETEDTSETIAIYIDSRGARYDTKQEYASDRSSELNSSYSNASFVCDNVSFLGTEDYGVTGSGDHEEFTTYRTEEATYSDYYCWTLYISEVYVDNRDFRARIMVTSTEQGGDLKLLDLFSNVS